MGRVGDWAKKHDQITQNRQGKSSTLKIFAGMLLRQELAVLLHTAQHNSTNEAAFTPTPQHTANDHDAVKVICRIAEALLLDGPRPVRCISRCEPSWFLLFLADHLQSHHSISGLRIIRSSDSSPRLHFSRKPSSYWDIPVVLA